MALEEIFPFVYGLRMGYVNAFLLAEEDGITLIDSGLPKRQEKILGELTGLGRQPRELKHIAITHHHVDHTGSLAALVKATGAQVHVHPLDAPIVRGEKPVPGPNPRSILGKVVGPLFSRLPAPKPGPGGGEDQTHAPGLLPLSR